MDLRLLLDEDTERELATKLRHAGHDVERVVEASDLGTGATDERVRHYARNASRIIVTHDDDHVTVEPTQHAGVFYAPNQRLSAFQLFRIIQHVSKTYPDRDEIPPVVYLTTDWLD